MNTTLYVFLYFCKVKSTIKNKIIIINNYKYFKMIHNMILNYMYINVIYVFIFSWNLLPYNK